jgi:hypothetical protein
MRGYDDWKTTPPDDPPEDPDCTCYHHGRRRHRRDKWCPVHGKDPDQAYEEQRDRRSE